jgi:hypothetical protein
MEHVKTLARKSRDELPDLLPLAALVYAWAIAVVWIGLLLYSHFSMLVHQGDLQRRARQHCPQPHRATSQGEHQRHLTNKTNQGWA